MFVVLGRTTMAQLPPKVPNVSPSLTSFVHQKGPLMANVFPASSAHAGAAASHLCWVDEFFDFSSAAQRGAQGRSLSDTLSFFDPQAAASTDESHSDGTMAKGNRVQDFDRLGVDHLMSMFSDSIPSDHDSVHEEKIDGRSAQEVADPNSQEELSRCKIEPPEASGMQQVLAAESAVDPKRIKRILANRQSAQRSRVRKLQYISELEQSVMSLQTEVAELSPRVAFLDHQRSLLTVGNSALKQRIAALAQDKIFKDAHQEVLKKEIERLRQVYSQKNLKKMPSAVGPPPSPHHKVEKLLS